MYDVCLVYMYDVCLVCMYNICLIRMYDICLLCMYDICLVCTLYVGVYGRKFAFLVQATTHILTVEIVTEHIHRCR